MGEKDPLDSKKSPLFRIDLNKKPKMGLRDFVRRQKEAELAQREQKKAEEEARKEVPLTKEHDEALSKEPKMGLRDFVRQQNEAELAQRERQKAEEEARKEAQLAWERVAALESIPVKDHPLCKKPADFINLYVKSVLILRAELPLAYSDPGEEKKQLRFFAKSLGVSREHQIQLEQVVSRCSDQTKKETLLKLASSRCDADGMTCLMCDVARLHGARYPFEGDFADFWRAAARGIAKLPDEYLAAAENLSRDIARGGKLARAEKYEPVAKKYAPIAKALVTYFGQEAFIPEGGGSDPNGKYLVIDLSGGSWAKQYPFRWTDGDPDISKAVGRTAELWLRRIPAGTFTMGSPGGELGHCSDEISHQVTLTQDYFIGIFPVTQRQWERVMGNNPSRFESAGPGAPVEQVSYNDICGIFSVWPGSAHVAPGSFLGKLRAKTGLAGFDLPTEAQWEYACRAGTTTALNNGRTGSWFKVYSSLWRLISGGTVKVCPEFDGVCWYKDNSGGTTHRVGEKRPNAWGLYDMHGNVWEWCRDWYDSYGDEATDPVGPVKGGERVARGGSWFNTAKYCRSAVRSRKDPYNRFDHLGFRLVFVPGQ